MSVKPPPQTNKIEDFVYKGSLVQEDTKPKEEDKWTMISVRIPSSLLQRVDEKRSKQIGLTRNAWILGIIQKNIEE